MAATYNGLLAALTKGGTTASDLLTGTSFVPCVVSVPAKFYPHVEFGIAVTQGLSGGFTVSVIGGVGGATYVVARRQNITAVGSFPVPLVVYGFSGNDPSLGCPRPYGVEFHAPVAATGFTAQVFMAGEYS